MVWWQWLLVLWVGGTAGLAALLAVVVFGQEAVGRLSKRGSRAAARGPGEGAEAGSDDDAEPAPGSIDLRDRPATADRTRDSQAAPEPCS
jgi:hypothetical protein